ncbi:hypothetical protein TNCV_3318441 [Trichonephila clavipes]|nr:hypothetical protein TNCV_3318441 [Trichonephila clavipes]
MTYGYATCKRSIEYLFGLDALGKMKVLVRFLIVRAWGVAEFDENIHRGESRQHGDDESNRTWNRKLRLVGKNHHTSSIREDNEPAERQKRNKLGIWSDVVGLKELALIKICHFFREFLQDVPATADQNM